MRRFICVALIAIAPAVLHAQDAASGGGGRGQRMQQMLFQNITLSDQQQKQVDSIRAVYRPQMQSAERGQRHEIMQKEAADFRTVLTPDQQTQFDKNIADMRANMRGGASPQ